MRLRQLGLFVQELESGPYVFLLVRSMPVAYQDKSRTAVPPGCYRTDKFYSKGHTAALNKWLQKKEHIEVADSHIRQVFAGLGAPQPAGKL